MIPNSLFKSIFLTSCVLLSLLIPAQSQETTEPNMIKVLGYIEPFRSIEMTSPEAGVIGKIEVQEGDTVIPGQALMSLENSILEAQLRIAEVQSASTASISGAQAELNVANDRYSKLSKLRNSGTAHSAEVARASSAKISATARLNLAQEEKTIAGLRVDEIKAQIERRTLRSPIDGIVLEINRDIAESASNTGSSTESDPVLVRVAKLDRLRLVVHIPSIHARNLKKGDQLPIRVLLENSLQSQRGDSAVETSGIIEFISPVIDPSSETVKTRLVIENADYKLRSGSHALVLITPSNTPSPSNLLTTP